MRLERDECGARLAAADHAVLSTVHPRRGVDAVPVCFVVDGGQVVIPVDRVKPKRSTRVQRTANLDADPRASLLVERWDGDDWSRLWWVRATLRRVPPPTGRRDHHEQLLLAKYRQYRLHVEPSWDPEDGSTWRRHQDGTRSEVAADGRAGPRLGSGPFVELLVFEVSALSGWCA